MKKETQEATKELKDTSESEEEESEQIVYSGFDNSLSDKLLPGYTDPSMAVDKVSRPRVLNCPQPGCLRDMGPVDKYEDVASCLYAFLIRNLHHSNVFLSKLSGLF